MPFIARKSHAIRRQAGRSKIAAGWRFSGMSCRLSQGPGYYVTLSYQVGPLALSRVGQKRTSSAMKRHLVLPVTYLFYPFIKFYSFISRG